MDRDNGKDVFIEFIVIENFIVQSNKFNAFFRENIDYSLYKIYLVTLAYK